MSVHMLTCSAPCYKPELPKDALSHPYMSVHLLTCSGTSQPALVPNPRPFANLDIHPTPTKTTTAFKALTCLVGTGLAS